MFAPSINVDLEKMKGEEVEEEQPKVRKAKATPKARRATPADKSAGTLA
jgi:hypothetical protein